MYPTINRRSLTLAFESVDSNTFSHNLQLEFHEFMLGSKVVYNLYNLGRQKVILSYQRIKYLPDWFKEKVQAVIDYFTDLKYKINNIQETNFRLGIEHLHKNNLNDAILRFKLVEKFFAPNDPQVGYWLGWTYFLKNNYAKALLHLQKSYKADQTKLGVFLGNYKDISEVPQPIWQQYRNLTAQYYTKKFHSSKIHLPYAFVSKTMSMITNLPDTYSILELGSNVGLISYEVKKRFPDYFTFTAVENSKNMNQLVSRYYAGLSPYDQLIEMSLPDFLTQNTNKYDIVLCYDSLSFSKNLEKYFNLIFKLTTKLGYFAFCLPIDKTTGYSLQRKEFIFTTTDIELALRETSFIILDTQELELEKNSKYYMVVCKKNN